VVNLKDQFSTHLLNHPTLNSPTYLLPIELPPNVPEQYLEAHTLQLFDLNEQKLKIGRFTTSPPFAVFHPLTCHLTSHSAKIPGSINFPFILVKRTKKELAGHFDALSQNVLDMEDRALAVCTCLFISSCFQTLAFIYLRNKNGNFSVGSIICKMPREDAKGFGESGDYIVVSILQYPPAIQCLLYKSHPYIIPHSTDP
jgi:hypothetical protein